MPSTPFTRLRRFILPFLGLALRPLSAPIEPTPAWWSDLRQVEIPSSDGSSQPAMWYAPESTLSKPLLVGLHTWSSRFDDAGQLADFVAWCHDQGWIFLRPHYRGPNDNPQAMGSDRAVLDVLEAVAWARQQADVDPHRIYLIGGSGGGHMALLVAARHPQIWAGVSAWCGITDLVRWHAEVEANPRLLKYARDIEAALGGSPASDPRFQAEAWRRSPVTALRPGMSTPLDINHGFEDTVVPFAHALRAFNAAAPASARLDDGLIDDYAQTGHLPAAWSGVAADACYGRSPPLFRRVAGNVRVTIFAGGHDLVYQAALNWLAAQRLGSAPVWELASFIHIDNGPTMQSR